MYSPTLPISVNGAGGPSLLGAGGSNFAVGASPTLVSNAGNAGSNYGGGSSGAYRANGATGAFTGTTTGVSGATGVVIVEEFY